MNGCLDSVFAFIFSQNTQCLWVKEEITSNKASHCWYKKLQSPLDSIVETMVAYNCFRKWYRTETSKVVSTSVPLSSADEDPSFLCWWREVFLLECKHLQPLFLGEKGKASWCSCEEKAWGQWNLYFEGSVKSSTASKTIPRLQRQFCCPSFLGFVV